MIWALLAVFLLSSSGSAELSALFQPAKTFVTSEIQDKAHRKELLAIIADAEKTTAEYVQSRGAIVKDLETLTASHGARTEDIQLVLARFRADTDAYQEQIIKHRFELKTKMTREEWVKAFAAEAIAPAHK